jgi:tetratricopeptide (TPR) repeat protein
VGDLLVIILSFGYIFSLYTYYVVPQMLATHSNPTETPLQVDSLSFSKQVDSEIQVSLTQFDKTLHFYVYFNLAFAGLASVEFLSLLYFFSSLVKSSVLAISLAALFLTIFTYFILRLFFQARHPEQFIDIHDAFITKCHEKINYQEGIPKHHTAIATASSRFAKLLNEREYAYYKPPYVFDVLSPMMESFSCWWHWEHVHYFRELFLITCVEEHIKLVKCEPTNLEIHAALANAYVTLSSLYADPSKAEETDSERWIPQERTSQEIEEKFRITAAKAIEEFKILHVYAPNDPWVHEQLAYSYHDLQMPEEEIREYETILRLCPDNKETLFKLGVLYFQQGKNADGLHIYEELKRSHYTKAENLMSFYGAHLPFTSKETP